MGKTKECPTISEERINISLTLEQGQWLLAMLEIALENPKNQEIINKLKKETNEKTT